MTRELQLKMLFGGPKARSPQSAFKSCSPGPDGRYGYVRPFLCSSALYMSFIGVDGAT